ncbi:TIGR02285 family protein [Methylobacterium organophilum]|uniref:Solute-binding protein family 3/N-terminal domain-containing protein n=1 Tax=Methylobacterium organophilum TaxID=410 RepID=A0ABQ4T8F3_METOR|nr:TIGR02285 family protein [Methylobacterium organophilum]UMY19632.1 TIGR02285 family protein [Methylobacterium organophilum]GJE26485.1 hypothetical protein LKMONMHP_1336 [Methylobacterium organophilum]
MRSAPCLDVVASPAPDRRERRLFSKPSRFVVDRGRGAFAVLALLLAALLPGTAKAQDKEIGWTIYDAAPFMITDGPDRDRGIFDRIRQRLIERLDGYRHRMVTVPFPRVLHEIRKGADWCFVGGVKTPERETFAVFSLPVSMFYPLRIMVHAPRRATFDALGPLSLNGLLKDRRDLRTSVLRDRSLGLEIDALLRANAPLPTHSEFSEAFRMLLNDRLDYLVEYPTIARYGARRLGAEEAFVGLPFAETPEPVFSRVMCANTPNGQEVVARVNAVLREERPGAAWREIVESWSEPADLQKIRAVYDTRFLTGE